MKRLSLLFALTAISALPSTAGTVTIYDNFTEGPGDSTNPYNGSSVNAYIVAWQQAANWATGGILPFGNAQAMPFTVGGGQDLYLQAVAMAMYKWPSNTQWNALNKTGTNHDNLTIELAGSQAGGSLPNPAQILEVLAIDPVITEDDTTFLNLSSASHPLLQQGQTYWVIARPTVYSLTGNSYDTLYGWIQNNEGAKWNYTLNQYNPADYWQGFYNASSNVAAPTLSVAGSTSLDSATPEPASALLSIAGLWLVALWRRRHA